MLSDFQTLVDALVRDQSAQIQLADRDSAIARAVARYSKDRPDEDAEDVTAPGGHFLDLPPGWEFDFSSLRLVEHPIGDVPPNLIPQDEIALYRDPAGLKIMLRRSINAGESVRLTFTIAHVLDLTTDTIPSKDREPVAAWAAALLLDELASYFSSQGDSELQVDVTDRRSKASEYAARANRLRTRYYQELGIDPKRNAAAGVVVDLDSRDSRGNERLLHHERFR